MSVQPKLLVLGLLLLLSNLIFAQNTKSITVGEYQTTIKDKRLALVIGNNDYSEVSKLSNPINDAKAIKNALEACGFEVMTLENGTEKSIKEKVREFSEKLKSYDVGLFYYSGHGIEVNGVNYIAPVDIVREATANDIAEECVATEFILSKMGEAGQTNKTYIMVLDACRDNPFKNIFKDLGNQTWKAPSVVPSGSITCFAASQGEKAIEGNVLSPYTELFLEHITTPGLRIEDVFIRVRNDLAELKKRNAQIIQEPVEVNKLNSVFYFVPLKDDKTTQNNSIPEENKKELSTLKILSTANGTIKIDGELKGSIKKNEIKVFKLEPGEYFVQLFTEIDNIPYNEEIKLSASITKTLKFEIISKNQNISKTVPDKSEPGKIDNNNLVINIEGKNLEVYHKNLGEMKWQDAKKSCEKLGAGWRLPTYSEYEHLWKNLHSKGKGDFKSGWYYDNDENFIKMEINGYVFIGRESNFKIPNFEMPKKGYVIPVRDL